MLLSEVSENEQILLTTLRTIRITGEVADVSLFSQILRIQGDPQAKLTRESLELFGDPVREEIMAHAEGTSPLTLMLESGEQKQMHVLRGADYFGVLNVLMAVMGRPEPLPTPSL